MIELINISKNYQLKQTIIQALENIQLKVNAGDIVGVIGKSGAGKSTLIRCINLLERPTTGAVYVAGEALTSLSSKALRLARRRIGMIFQHFSLLNSITVFDNVALPLRLTGQNSSDIRKVVMPLLELVGLADKLKTYPAQLSGGQKQRVGIARALVMQPQVLLCDEATSALDPQNTEAILQLLRTINQQFNLTILLITHEMHVIKQICDRVVVLEAGRIIEQGAVADIFARPQQPITQYFVDSALKAELPHILREKVLSVAHPNSMPVLRIYFRGHAAAEPIIAHLAKNIGITLTIMQANLECIQQYTIGIMIAAVETVETDLADGLRFLNDKGLQVEIIGYVSRDAI